MPTVLSTPTIDPSTLSPGRRAALVDRLYEVQCAVFDGVDRELLARYVVDSPAERTALRVYSDEDGCPVGYLALHFFERELGDARALIIRGESGFRREFRGRSTAIPFALREMLGAGLRWHHGPAYFLACPVHPVSYWVLERNVRTLYPHPKRRTPPAVESLICELADDFGLSPVDRADPFVREVGWRTRETETERQLWREHPSEAVRYYLARNPEYSAGRGLLTLIPRSAINIASALFNVGTRPLRRAWTRARRSSGCTPTRPLAGEAGAR